MTRTRRTSLKRYGKIGAWLVTAALVVAWILNPQGPWEPWLAFIALVTTALAEVYSWLKPALSERFATSGERARHRENLRQVLQDEIYRRRAEGLRSDVIIRDVDRLDGYPDLPAYEKGISAWFRLGLIETYNKGVRVGLRYGGLKASDDGYRFVDFVNEESSDRRVLLLGEIPYDSIATVNLEGDEIYPYAHIYCHFDFDGQPYERLWFGERIEVGTSFYYEFVASYEDVTRNNPTDGPLHFV